jgi:hypothetical protein
MINNAIGAQRIFNGQYVDGDQNPLTGVDGRELCLHVINPPGSVVWDNPCDTLTTRIEVKTTDCPPARFVDDDCNECTGVRRG